MTPSDQVPATRSSPPLKRSLRRGAWRCSAIHASTAGASTGVDSTAGGPRASELIRKGLGFGAAARIPCRAGTAIDPDSGLAVATVHCRGRLRLTFLPLDLPLWIDVTTSSLKEGAP